MSVLDHQTGVPSGGPKGACLSWTTKQASLLGGPKGLVCPGPPNRCPFWRAQRGLSVLDHPKGPPLGCALGQYILLLGQYILLLGDNCRLWGQNSFPGIRRPLGTGSGKPQLHVIWHGAPGAEGGLLHQNAPKASFPASRGTHSGHLRVGPALKKSPGGF